MLLHMSLHCPERADLELWPFTLEHSAYLWNHLPRADTRLSPKELYTGSLSFSYDHLARLHTFGCPVYVLHPRLQDGHKVPKGQPWDRRGQFMGYSMEHSSSIGLTLNTNTGNISPQYHVVHDYYFTTVPSVDSTKTFDAASWQAILQTGVELYLSDDIDRFGKTSLFPRSMTSGSPRKSSVITLNSPSATAPSLRGSTLTISLSSHIRVSAGAVSHHSTK
jgi:hypothetical protein